MIEITGYENIGKGKYRTTFDNGTTCVLYRTEAVRYSIMEGAFISEADYEKLITEVVGKRAKKRALHLLEQMDLVHDHNFAVQMGGNGECQFHEHAAGIALDRRVDKVANLGELNNFRHLGVNFGAGHT